MRWRVDHIHFLLRYRPTTCLSAVIGTLKSRSASALLDRFGSFYWGRHSRTLWSSDSSFAPLAELLWKFSNGILSNKALANPAQAAGLRSA
ncbi:MAG: hypothetical protein DMG32_25075 [Acidobacteria bacterium]|nr:MAG: hypothetical protein DMG32_25075 [Acidobacteriota bacterium]